MVEGVVGASADPGDAVGNVDVLQAGAVGEGAPADAGDAVGQRDRGEAAVAEEGERADRGELAAVGEDDLLEVEAVVHGPVGEAGHAGSHVELLDGLVILLPWHVTHTCKGIEIPRTNKLKQSAIPKDKVRIFTSTPGYYN